jgi:hypothetical protein
MMMCDGRRVWRLARVQVDDDTRPNLFFDLLLLYKTSSSLYHHSIIPVSGAFCNILREITVISHCLINNKTASKSTTNHNEHPTQPRTIIMSDVETPEAPRSSQRPPSIVRKPSVEVPSSNASYNGRSQSRASPPPTVDPRTASRRFAVIMCGILIIICLGIVAIVLPFFLGDDCNCPRSSEAGGPAASSAPEATPAPTPVREEVTQRFRQFVDNYATDISGGEPFEDPGSPQYRAAQFIADDYDFTQEITDLSQLNDLYALAVFYYSTQGDSWRQCSQESTNCGGESWMDPQVGHCNWNYVTCDDAGRVTGIVFGKSKNRRSGITPTKMNLCSRSYCFWGRQ